MSLPDSCIGCPLYELGVKSHTKFTSVEGKGSNGILLIGEASGEHEDRVGLPFRPSAPAGSILEKVIRSRWKRDDFVVTNLIRCRPPFNNLEGMEYEEEAIKHCKPNLDKVIDRYKPKAIVALGSLPTKYLTGFYSSKPRDKKTISYSRGFVLESSYGLPTIPTYHPSFIARGNTRLIPLLIKDISVALMAGKGYVNPIADPFTEIELKEGVEELEKLYEILKNDEDLWLAYDIETIYSLKDDEDDITERMEELDNEIFRGDFEGDTYYSREGISPRDGSGSYNPISSDDSQMVPGEQLEREDNPQGDIDPTRSYEGSIISIQFAISERWGVWGDWRDERVRRISQAILQLPNTKVGHNIEGFDIPRLESEGIIIKGEQLDTLPMRKCIQPDLPANLQQVAVDYDWPFPWKHYSGTNAKLYGIVDVCSVIKIIKKLLGELEKARILDSYIKFIKDFRLNILNPWEKRGIPIDINRLNEYREFLTLEIETKTKEIIRSVPDSLHSRHPEKGYTNLFDPIKEIVLQDSGVKALLEPTLKQYKNGKTALIASKIKAIDIYKMLCEGSFPDLLSKILTNNKELILEDFNGVKRLSKFIPFNPMSSIQLLKYIKLKGYEIPRTFKEKKETTGDKEIKKLERLTKDPVLSLARNIRALTKMKTSYASGSKGGWIPSSDGRLHPIITNTSTWQMASKSPNVMTMPSKRPELAEGFRRIVRAESGHTLIEFDYKSFHACMVAREARDLDFMRLSQIDIHSYVTGHMMKWPGIATATSLSDTDLKEMLDEIKSHVKQVKTGNKILVDGNWIDEYREIKYKQIRNLQAKPTILGIPYGQSSNRIFFDNDDVFNSLAEVRKLMRLLKSLFPKVFEWQEEIIEKADKQHYLISLWNHKKWFWDAYSYKMVNDKWVRAGKGLDAEKAMSFLPQNHAHGMLRLKLLEMDAMGYLSKYELINVIHDAVLFHCPIKYIDECISNIRGIMESPVIELADNIICPDGFSCSVEISMGDDWAKNTMREIKL